MPRHIREGFRKLPVYNQNMIGQRRLLEVTSSSPPLDFMILSSRPLLTFFRNKSRRVSRPFSRETNIGTGLKSRFGARKSGDEGGDGSILGLNIPLIVFWGRVDKGEDREGVNRSGVAGLLQGVVGVRIMFDP
jgi:hypothetical protein